MADWGEKMGNFSEICINYKNLKNDIVKLRKIGTLLDSYNAVSTEFSESKGLSKNALDDELKTMCAAGVTLQQAVNTLADELETIAENFKLADELLSALFTDICAPTKPTYPGPYMLK